ncbi:hypothetical protein GCM10017602_01570 [Herbiconiux flava]|nr:hypothetical protein GCM10017602_01570 [Herbiconiux flava]
MRNAGPLTVRGAQLEVWPNGHNVTDQNGPGIPTFQTNFPGGKWGTAVFATEIRSGYPGRRMVLNDYLKPGEVTKLVFPVRVPALPKKNMYYKIAFTSHVMGGDQVESTSRNNSAVSPALWLISN